MWQPDARALSTLQRQQQVATWVQLEAWGLPLSSVQRRIAAGQWQRVFRHVVALHSQPLAWEARALAAVLSAGRGAALSHLSAAYLHRLTTTPGLSLHVSIPHSRTTLRQPGLVVTRRRRMPATQGTPRRTAIIPTVLDTVALLDSEDDVIGLLTSADRRGVVAAMLIEAIERRAKMRHRALILDLLAEVADGVESPLELRYVRDVERRHGLPTSVGQHQRDLGGGLRTRADRRYVDYGVVVELDGQLAHPQGRTERDTWRDNATAIVRGELTLRYRWIHVAEQHCQTARQVAAALVQRGWEGGPRRCSPDCPVHRG